MQEVQVGSLIATLADGDVLGHPFWIAKVIDLIKDDSQTTILSLKVHWYHTTSKNAFTGKYTLEMMSTTTRIGAKKKKKIVRRISTLHLVDVDVILYRFTLTKSGHLRQSTIAMLEEKFKATSTRQTRSATHDLVTVGLHLDEDNALINSSKEDESLFEDTNGGSEPKKDE